MSHALFKLLDRLDLEKVHYTLSRHRPDTVLVTVTLVGERVEVEVFVDGHMELSRFTGDESVAGGAELLDEILSNK